MGIFSVGGNAGFAVGPVAAGFSAYQFGIKGLIIYAVVNFLTALYLMKKLPAIKKTQRDRKRECHSNEPQPKNDWNAFGKLSFVIFARSIGFLPSLTPLSQFTGSAFLAHQQAAAVLPFPAFFHGGCHDFFGRYPGRQSGTHQGHADILPRHGPRPLLSHKQYQPNDSNPALGADGSFPFAPYSPMVILGQTYLARNIGFASGVTLGLSASVGGLISPLVGWAADRWGVGPSLQILWIVAAIGCFFAFLVPVRLP